MREKGSVTRISLAHFWAAICLAFCLQHLHAAEVPAEKGPWKYKANKCTNFSNAGTWAADCAILDGGTWTGSGTGSNPFRCKNASHPRPWSAEAQIEPLSSARSGGVASLQDWQSENSSVHCTGVFDTGTLTKTLGVESGNVALISIDGNAGAWGATRGRDVKCPSGSWTLGDRCLQHPVADPYRAFVPCTKNTTNPVNAFTGAKVHSETDFRGAGPNPLVFKRYYSTRTPWRFAPWEESGFGTYWRHNYMRSIEHFKNDTFEAVTVYLGNGNRNYFTPQIVDETVIWTATEPDISSVLTSLNVDGTNYWDLRKSDGSRERYAKNTGKLAYAMTRDGFKTNFEYDDRQRLSRVSNDFGRSLVFTYAEAGAGAGLIESVALHVNSVEVPESVIRYDYENTNPSGYQVMLDKVIYPDDTPEDLSDNLFKDYLYNEQEHIYFDEQSIVNVEDGPSARSANHPSKLTGIVDENGTRSATYKYQRVLLDGGHRFMLPVWGGHGAPDVDGRYAKEYKITRYQPTSARSDSRSHQGYASIKDALGTERQFHFKNYSGVLRPTEIVGAKCEVCGSDSQKIGYDSSGYVNRRVDFAGNETIYQRNELGLEVCRIEGASTMDSDKNAPRRIVTQWQNDERVMLSRQVYQPTAAADFVTCNINDNSGWILRRETLRHYEADSARITSELVQSYNESGEQDEPPRVTSYTYYGNEEQWGLPNQLKQVDGPRTDVIDIQTYRYAVVHSAEHSPGDLVEIENALGHVVRINKHDSFGRPLDITSPNGSNEILTYYPRGWLKSRSVDGHETSYTYDGLGQLKKITSPNGSVIMQDYDQAHRLTDIRDNLGNHIHYTLDPMGNRIGEEIRDPSGVLKKHSLRLMNATNQVEKQIAIVDDIVSNLTGFLYDINGFLHKVIDPRDPEIEANSPLPNSAQVFSELTYDALNRVKLRRNNEGNVTLFTYDIFDQLSTVTEPNDGNASTPQGLITRYFYNSYGDLRVLESPDTGVSKYDYDSAGNRIKVQRATDIDAGKEISYQYDALNRLRRVDYENAALNVIYVYDQQGDNQNGIGRLTSIFDANGETFLFYDKRGNTEKITSIREGIQKESRFSYNGANQPIFMITPGGMQINYFYQQSADGGASNQLDKLELGVGDVAEVLAHSVNYLPFGPLSGWTYGNDIVSSWTFDLSYRIQNLRHGGVWDKGFSLDAADNISQISDGTESGHENNYIYDHLDWLTDAVIDNETHRYNYDAVGNRRSTIEGAAQYGYSYETDRHHLIDVAGQFSYDLNGNVQFGRDIQYEYGDDNRMKSIIHNNGETISYQHNALGQRTAKSGNYKTLYYHDPQGRLIEETDKFGNTAKTYVHLGNYPLALIEEDIDPFDDADEDGMLNGFESYFGFYVNDPLDAEEDFDGDGFSNLSEHDAETDPTYLLSFPNASSGSVKQVPALGKVAGVIAAILIMAVVLPHLNSASVVVALVLFCSWVISESVSSKAHSRAPLAVSDSPPAFLK